MTPTDDRPALTRRDMALLRPAARGRWRVPDRLKEDALDQLHLILTGAHSSDRDRVSAAKTLALLDRIDQADERQAMERTRVEIKLSAGRPPRSIDPVAARAALMAAGAVLGLDPDEVPHDPDWPPLPAEVS